VPTERLTLAQARERLAARTAGLDPGAQVGDRVREIIERVRSEGDAAVLALTRELDTGGAEPWPPRVDPLELRRAADALPGPLRDGLELAAGNVRTLALAGVHPDRELDLPEGQRVTMREIPVARAAIYVPGGRAPYPSTVVMGVTAAQAAGVEQVVVTSPPGPGSETVLGACALCGVEEVYRMGGAQAVAALALGTESVPPVDVVAGPGNLYVQEAKRQLSGVVGIDSFAGPTELVVVLDVEADARLAALDLRAQAEHGPDTLLMALSPADASLDALATHLADVDCLLVDVPDLDAGLELAEEVAPEHLQLMGADAEALAPRVRRAGCVFVGSSSGTAFGDYVAGSNHVLPTGGSARFASALGPRMFRRAMPEVRVGRAAESLAPAGASIARAEGFELHAQSMEARIRENGPDG
jgi:histidinol dehydrogenase